MFRITTLTQIDGSVPPVLNISIYSSKKFFKSYFNIALNNLSLLANLSNQANITNPALTKRNPLVVSEKRIKKDGGQIYVQHHLVKSTNAISVLLCS